MKISYDFILKDFEGNAMQDGKGNDLPAYKAASNLILNSPSGGPDAMKRFRWAQELYQDKGIDLDRAGQQEFREMILSAPDVNLLVRGLLIDPLSKVL